MLAQHSIIPLFHESNVSTSEDPRGFVGGVGEPHAERLQQLQSSMEAGRQPSAAENRSRRTLGRLWQSQVNENHGKLRCLISSEPDGLYRARFHAKYAVPGFGYTVKLREPRVTTAGSASKKPTSVSWRVGFIVTRVMSIGRIFLRNALANMIAVKISNETARERGLEGR